MALDLRIRLLQWLATRSGRVFRPALTTAQYRAGYAAAMRDAGPRTRACVDARDVRIPTDAGEIGARLYRPAALPDRQAPLLVFFHGGGFVIGDVASYDGCARFLAAEGALLVLSVDYRLGPEHPFPRGYEDGFAAYAWSCANAEELGADARAIALGGDSAGGGIAASVGAYAVARGLPRPAYQYLIYPSVDARGEQPSRHDPSLGVFLNEAMMRWFGERYLLPNDDPADPLRSPLLAPTLAQSPPTYLLAAAYDPLVDEGRQYADRLRAERVPVTYDLRPTLPHGLLNVAGVVPAARRALRDGIRATGDALRAQLAGVPSVSRS
ncbi:MAG TPA: alpha/beta hydrolase [Candidatus Baltobacteraceae bacterium]|nr:alpha/beta hydrolase [Candidatus Baltobacteraceae bacterium]